MSDEVVFLRLVLPSSGHYCYATKPPGAGSSRMVRRWAISIEELAQRLSDYATHADAWFSTASFKDNTSSGAANVLALKAFRLDIDCKPQGKDCYRSKREAVTALSKFLTASGLPRPICVSSGYGLHVWWPLDQAITREVWLPYAQALKSACAKHGLLADPTVTADAARILRCPGSWNYKDEAAPREVKVEDGFRAIGPYPLFLFDVLGAEAAEAAGEVVGDEVFPNRHLLNPDAIEYYRSMLEAIPNNDGVLYATWFKVGAAIYELGWGDEGRKLFHEWSARASKHSESEFENVWSGYRKYRVGRQEGEIITPGTLVHMADECGWSPPRGTPRPDPVSSIDFEEVYKPAASAPAGAADRLREFVEIYTNGAWMTTTAGGKKQPDFTNTCKAMLDLGFNARTNALTGQRDAWIPWEKDEWEPIRNLNDTAGLLRSRIFKHTGYQLAGDKYAQAAISELASRNTYNPILDYLNGLQWDGTPRIDTWIADYLGADDNALNREISSKFLIAAVRRMRQPGCKFDSALVLQSGEGTGKSSAVSILANGAVDASDGRGQYYNRDVSLIEASPQRQIEGVRGFWFIELPEITGAQITRATAEKVKAFISCESDSGRLAYQTDANRYLRTCVFVVTTNHEDLLVDATGNRRFWPVKVKKADDAAKRTRAFIAARDQLFAEAAHREAAGESLIVSKPLWADALARQAEFTAEDGFTDALQNVVGEVVETKGPRGMVTGRVERVLRNRVLEHYLKLDPKEQTIDRRRRADQVMQNLGWEPKRMNIDGGKKTYYYRTITIGENQSEESY